MPTAQRLRDPALFRAAVRRGRRAGSSSLVVHWQESSPGAPTLHSGPQVGMVVSRAVGNAVTRNLVKRRLRHLVREHLASTALLPGSGVLVLRALPSAAAVSFSELRADLERCLERVIS